MTPPKFNLMVFVSSTFTDTGIERNILLDRILPELREIARQYVDIEICFIDLRWGLKDSLTNDHLTWISCANEIRRCRDSSAGLFFISLQSEKYGYCPLPRSMPKELFETRVSEFLLNNSSENDKDIVERTKKWYVLDENNIPPEYVLVSLTEENKNEYWDLVLPHTLKVLQDAPFDNDPDLLVGRSVTEFEFKFAMKNENIASRRCIWFQRKFADSEITKDEDPKKHFCDSYDDESIKLKKLKLLTHMESLLSCDATCPLPSIIYPVDENDNDNVVMIPLSSYVSEVQDIHREKYENAWYTSSKNRLSFELRTVIDRYKEWRRTGGRLNVPGPVADEILHHYEWCRLKCSTFIGRDELINEAQNLIYNEGCKSERCINVAIIGKSGSVSTVTDTFVRIRIPN